MKEKSRRDFSWQSGYAPYSVGRSEVSDVMAYIQKQEDHHKKISFQDEIRRFAQDAGLDLDERYA